MRNGHEIAATETARLEMACTTRFQPDTLHPVRRARILAGDEIEQAAGGLDQPDAMQPVAIARREQLFGRRAETKPKDVRPGAIDVVDDALFVAVAAQIAAAVAGDVEVGIKLAHALRGPAH